MGGGQVSIVFIVGHGGASWKFLRIKVSHQLQRSAESEVIGDVSVQHIRRHTRVRKHHMGEDSRLLSDDFDQYLAGLRASCDGHHVSIPEEPWIRTACQIAKGHGNRYIASRIAALGLQWTMLREKEERLQVAMQPMLNSVKIYKSRLYVDSLSLAEKQHFIRQIGKERRLLEIFLAEGRANMKQVQLFNMRISESLGGGHHSPRLPHEADPSLGRPVRISQGFSHRVRSYPPSSCWWCGIPYSSACGKTVCVSRWCAREGKGYFEED